MITKWRRGEVHDQATRSARRRGRRAPASAIRFSRRIRAAAIRYVDTTNGSNSNSGLTVAAAWKTIAKAASVALPAGTAVRILAGTYTEAVGLVHSGVAGHSDRYEGDSWISYEPYGDGEVIVNGVGNRSTFYSQGIAYTRITGLTIENDGGATFTTASCGVELANDGDNGHTTNGTHHVEIVGNTFRNINRNSTTYPLTGYASPIVVYGEADTRLGGTATRAISIRDNVFHDGRLSTPTILHSHIGVAGCTQGVEIVGNEFVITRAADHAGQLTVIDSGAVTLNVNAAARTFTRTTGSFIVDGFSVSDVFDTYGLATAGNNGTWTIQTVTATVITVVDGTGMVNESGSGDEHVIVGVASVQGGIELSGNQIPGTFPDQPTDLVVTDNVWTGTAANGAYAIYVTACLDVLIERNYLDHPTWGIGVFAERGSGAGNTAQHVLVRDNVVYNPLFFGLGIGAFAQVADNYDTVLDVWAVHNTIRRTVTSPSAAVILVSNTTGGAAHGVAGVGGSSMLGANLVIAADGVLSSTLPAFPAGLMQKNAWYSAAAQPFSVNGTPSALPYASGQDTAGIQGADTVAHFDGDGASPYGFRLAATSPLLGLGFAVTALPSWFTRGMFGVFDPYADPSNEETDLYSRPRSRSDVGATVGPPPQVLTPRATRHLAG